MRTKRFVETLTIVFCILLSGCGEKRIVVKGSDGTEYESYQECCTASDFVAAHRYIDKMESQGQSTSEAREYVFREEALYLMSLGDDNAKKRIVYLLKQDDSGSHDEHCDMLVDLAIDADDEAFVKTLTKHYNGSIEPDILRKIVEYLYIEKDDDSNLDFVTTLLNRYDEEGMLLDAAVEKGDEALVVSLAQQYNGKMSFRSFKNVVDLLKSRQNSNCNAVLNHLITKVEDGGEELIRFAFGNSLTGDAKLFIENLIANRLILGNENLLSAIAAVKNNKYNEMILALLTDGERGIPAIPTTGLFKSDIDGVFQNDVARDYQSKVTRQNKDCAKILDIAIKEKNLSLAQKIVSRMRPNVSIEKLGAWPDIVKDGSSNISFKAYKVALNKDEILAAKNKLNDAVRSGAFK